MQTSAVGFTADSRWLDGREIDAGSAVGATGRFILLLRLRERLRARKALARAPERDVIA